MDSTRRAELKEFYRTLLLEDCLPFWLRHGKDPEAGGYHTCLDRDWSAYDHDKLCMWCHGRIVWTFSFLYNELERAPEWLEMARVGVDFIRKHGFAPDGGMYYSLTRDGRPLEAARDLFVELFTVSGLSEFARATRDDALYERARGLFLSVWDRLGVPGGAFQPFVAETRPVRLHGHSLITLNVLQELRRYREDPAYEGMIDACIRNILELHVRPERRAAFELVSWDGETIPGFQGRWVNPGHMMEAGIFIVHEGQRRRDDRLIEAGIDLIDWGFQRGWDREFGGIYNDVDAEGLPVPTMEVLLYQSKLWWQHAEALYALLLAHSVTGDGRFFEAYELTHNYCVEKFVDPEHGEWFAHLDRRGNRIDEAKGTSRKSPFHLARNCYYCFRLL